MYKQNYLQQLNQRRYVSKFNTIFESIMSDIQIYPQITPKHITDKRLNLILEQISKPQYIVCQSGDIVTLQQALFWDQDRLITQGVLETVFGKIKEITQKIKEGISAVISKGLEQIKAFCEKVKQNAIVAAIIKKLKLNSKLDGQKFKGFFNVQGDQKVAKQSVNNNSSYVICEATKLNKKEAALTDPKQIQANIDKWQKAANGQKPINGKSGKPLSKKYCNEKKNLFKKILNSLNNSQQKPSEENKQQNIQNTSGQTKQQGTDKKSEKSQKTSDKKSIGTITIDSNGLNSMVKNVYEESINQDTSKDVAITVGGDKAAKVINGNGEGQKTADQKQQKPKEQKKGFFKKALGKINDVADKVGGKITGKIKEWYAKQSKFVQVLIKVIIWCLVALGVYLIISTVIVPALTVIFTGAGIGLGISALFTVVSAGKTYSLTFKAGKEAVSTGKGYLKFFLLILASVAATISLGFMAGKLESLIASSGGDIVKQTTKNVETKVSENHPDVKGRNQAPKIGTSTAPGAEKYLNGNDQYGINWKNADLPTRYGKAQEYFKTNLPEFLPDNLKENYELSKLTPDRIAERYPNNFEQMLDKATKAKQAIDKWIINNPMKLYSDGTLSKTARLAMKKAMEYNNSLDNF